MHEVLMRHSLPFACRRVRGYKQGFVSDHFENPIIKADAISDMLARSANSHILDVGLL
jgi:hypothetical protein